MSNQHDIGQLFELDGVDDVRDVRGQADGGRRQVHPTADGWSYREAVLVGEVRVRNQLCVMIGFVTYGKQPDLTADDSPVLNLLLTRGLAARAVRWDDPDVRWEDFRVLVLRSTWDYHLRPREFVDWLEMISSADIALWNPAPLVRWNMHKRYLRELAARGVLIADTEWLARADPRPLSAIMRHRGWANAIVKPAISASATNTWLTSGDTLADDQRYRGLVERCDALVQEVIPQIPAAGEWSLVFLGGDFSHATLKRPRPGDFRVQVELGGSANPAVASAELLRSAAAVAELIPKPWLYARIDGVETPRGFMLMEVECIEPDLFLRHSPGAHERFANAISAVLAKTD